VDGEAASPFLGLAEVSPQAPLRRLEGQYPSRDYYPADFSHRRPHGRTKVRSHPSQGSGSFWFVASPGLTRSFAPTSVRALEAAGSQETVVGRPANHFGPGCRRRTGLPRWPRWSLWPPLHF